MDLKIPDLSHEVRSTEKRLLVPVDNNTDPNQDSPQEIQEREELAAELEAMMDAAVETEATEEEEEACIQSSDVEMDMNVDLDQTEETDTERNPPEQQEHEQSQSDPKPTPVLPLISPLLSTAPLKSDPAPRYPYLNRSIRVPISPAQKLIAQQFLRRSRDYLRDTSAGGLSRLGDEEREAANLKIQTGTGRAILEPATLTAAQSPTKYQQNGQLRSDTNQRISAPAPADDPGMHLNEIWRDLGRPSTADERRTFYGNSQRRKRQ